MQTLSAIAFVLRVSLGDANSPPPPPVPPPRIPRAADGRHPPGGLLRPSRSLDLHLSSTYRGCSRCVFPASPHWQRSRRNCWPRPNHRSNLSVYSIYKETHSSEGSAAHKRHYAGWATGRNEAILRANELYEGRDSIGAVVVIGNGPTEVEVVYRVDGEN